MSSAPWLVVGLGNPGSKYEHTRHNVGEATIRRWAQSAGVTLKRVKSWGEAAKIPGSPIVVAIPSGYMNTSGGPVAGLARYFKTPPEQVIVIHDDLDLVAHALKLKRGGGHGGHNGLRDIQKALGTPEFVRIRIGIGRPPGRMDPADYVLQKIPASHREDWGVTESDAIDAVGLMITDGLEAAQQRYHSAN